MNGVTYREADGLPAGETVQKYGWDHKLLWGTYGSIQSDGGGW